MPRNLRKTISEKQWRQAIQAYELGHKNGSQIARELGASPATVSREFKRRGACKACRVAETVVELEASLDAKARQRARYLSLKEAAAMNRLTLINAVIDDMVISVITAMRDGDLALASSKVAEAREALR